jgi:hypothetical protein
MTNEERIKYIIENFDFNRVYATMKALDWKWWDSDDIPTIGKIVNVAEGLLWDAIKSDEKEVAFSTGGFRATKYNNSLELSFIVSKFGSGGEE